MESRTDLVAQKDHGNDCDEVEPYDVSVVISSNDKDAKKSNFRRNIIRTIFDGLVILFLGMQASQKGPAFLDLQLISGTNVEGASSYFTANSFGYMVGALAAGFLYDRIDNKVSLICLPLVAASFLIGLTPLCTSYITMLLAHMASAFGCAIPETTITAEQFHVWKGKSESAFQFLSFTYSLGGVLGPLYTEPFLVPKWNKTEDSDDPQVPVLLNLRIHSLNKSIKLALTNKTIHDVRFDNNQSKSVSNFNNPESELYWAYMITGFFGILFSIPFFIMCGKYCFKPTVVEKKNEEIVEKVSKRLALKPYIILTAISSVLLFCYTITEDSFNMFLSMFVVSHSSWTKEDGALISSFYWGISTISKLISVPLVRKIDLGHLLLVSCAGMNISLTGLVLASHYYIDILIWISSCGFALSQASIFGGCFSWVDTNILKLDGKATSVVMISAACGAMVGPLILGITMDSFSLMVFPYIELGHSVMTTCIFAYMLFFLKPYVTQKYGPVRQNTIQNTIDIGNEEVGTEEKERMVSNVDTGCNEFIMMETNGKNGI